MLYGRKLESFGSQIGPCLHMTKYLVLYPLPSSSHLAPSCFSQGLSRVKANDLHHTAGAISDCGAACSRSNGSCATAVVNAVAAGGGCGRAGVAVHRACNPGAKKLWHGGH